jgi:ABC-type multidrug transport system fused ATPase/permease subunit
MTANIFIEKEFIGLILFSIVLPILLYWFLWHRRAISRFSVVLFGIGLIIIAGLDVFFLRLLADIAKNSISTLDDRFFNSELSVALYLFPALYAGTGINLISHILINHLTKAEKKFDKNNG